MSGRLPAWFKQKLPDPRIMTVRNLLGELSLHSICETALCPNIGECFCRETATFLILGDICTRRCAFCAVKKGIPSPLDPQEPERLLEAARVLCLSYVVITSVTRDDLPDGGAAVFARTIELLHRNKKGVVVEVLIPDFAGSVESLATVLKAAPEVIGHNIETIPRLYPAVRSTAEYNSSIELLFMARRLNPGVITKSGLMLGLGETKNEVIRVMEDLREADCQLLTIGQYLQPSPGHHPVIRYVHPQEFSEYEQLGRDLGFVEVASAPPVRSSFKAAEMFARAKTLTSANVGKREQYERAR